MWKCEFVCIVADHISGFQSLDGGTLRLHHKCPKMVAGWRVLRKKAHILIMRSLKCLRSLEFTLQVTYRGLTGNEGNVENTENVQECFDKCKLCKVFIWEHNSLFFFRNVFVHRKRGTHFQN